MPKHTTGTQRQRELCRMQKQVGQSRDILPQKILPFFSFPSWFRGYVSPYCRIILKIQIAILCSSISITYIQCQYLYIYLVLKSLYYNSTFGSDNFQAHLHWWWDTVSSCQGMCSSLAYAHYVHMFLAIFSIISIISALCTTMRGRINGTATSWYILAQPFIFPYSVWLPGQLILQQLLIDPQLSGKHWLIESWYKSRVSGFVPFVCALPLGIHIITLRVQIRTPQKAMVQL